MNEVLGVITLAAFGVSTLALGYVLGSRDKTEQGAPQPTIKHLQISVMAHIDTERNALDVYDARWEIKP